MRAAVSMGPCAAVSMGPRAAASTLAIHALLGGAKCRQCLHRLALLRLDLKSHDRERRAGQRRETFELVELRFERRFEREELMQ